jgi:signal transduction histidine kinase
MTYGAARVAARAREEKTAFAVVPADNPARTGTTSGRPLRIHMPDTVFGRLLAIALTCVGVPYVAVLWVAPEEQQTSLLGALSLVVPSLVLGMFCAARGITRSLAMLAKQAQQVGHVTEHATPAREHCLRNRVWPRELRELSSVLEQARSRVHAYVTNRSRALAAVSHDLKTPLTRMRLRVATLEDDLLREKLEVDIDELSAMVHAAIAMLKGMEHTESIEAIDVNELLARLQREFAEMGRPVTVTGRAREPYPGRQQALRRCLVNLIDNAIKFGHGASITLEDGPALRVKVADRGPGIAPEEMEKVFEPFYRAPAATSVEGSGLGLGIARDIALGHGGELRLRNGEARGLEAEIILPRKLSGEARQCGSDGLRAGL